ncbi:radical SAM protein [uncultured Adlercreutzia sp.]|uniref:radical SAM protein n=1 Tax=uncultured Adlercreutzia sp. TaxID=875803 RepID=UPI0026F3C4B3|nr:radical SAM protein [uncultured Adlercreutzia sp.]
MFKIYQSKSGRKYLYDSVSNNIFEMDDESYGVLGVEEGSTNLLRALGDDFWDDVYGKKTIPEESSFSGAQVAWSSDTPDILILELTQQCNFRCDYCIYSGSYSQERVHAPVSMTEADIDSVFEAYFQSDNYPAHLGFYGGEPLLGFELIRRICDRIIAGGLEVEFALTTNGELLNDEVLLQYIVSHNFTLNISYDGLNHDLYRHSLGGGASSCKIMAILERIKALDEEYFARNVALSVTLAPPYNLLANARHFSETALIRGLRLNVNTVNGADNAFLSRFDMSSEAEAFNADLAVLLDEYVDCGDEIPPFLRAIFGGVANRIENRVMSTCIANHPPGQCAIGKHRTFITATGEKYMCERVGSYGQFGRLSEGNDPGALRQIAEDFDKMSLPRCRNCHLVRICDMCMASIREGGSLGSDEWIDGQCCNKRSWYDMVFAAYLSRKEQGKSI